MIGRETQINEVTRLLTDPEVRGVALAGTAGVGTSRLARAVVGAAAQTGCTVHSVAATVTSQSIPLGAFAALADGADGSPSVLVGRIVDRLVAGKHIDRVVVFVDGAHLLDDLSALVVHHVVHSQVAKVVLTVRSDGPVPVPAALTALWKDGLLRRRDVGPLTRVQCDDLLTAVLGRPPDHQCGARLWRLTEGNVSLLVQLIEQESAAGRLRVDGEYVHWAGELVVSGSLADIVTAQVGEIGTNVRDVVDVVAVAEQIDWHCLRMLVDPRAIEQAEQRGLIRIAGDEVFAGHPMYAELRRSRCGSSKLRRLRGEVAVVMNDGGSAAQTMLRGLLWLDSDLPPEPDVLLAAATAASSLLDFEAARRLYGAAAATGVGAAARVPLAFSLFMTQHGDLAQDVLEGVQLDAETDTGHLNDVVIRASNMLWAMRSPERSWQVIDDALATARGVRRQQLLVFRANQLALAARPADVLATMADVDCDGLDDYGAAMGYGVQSMASGELGRPVRAVDLATRAYRVLDASDQCGYLRQPVTEFHTFALAAAGQIAEATEVARQHLHRQRAQPAPAQEVAAEIYGMAALAAGDLDAALTHLPGETHLEAADTFHVANSFHRFCLLRVQALVRAGDADAADRAMDVARARRHPAYVYVTSQELLAEAWQAAGRMRLTEARRLARGAAEFARTHDQFAREVWCLQTAVQFDDTDAALRLADLATLVGGPRVSVAARYAAALSADDADGLEAASLDFEAMGDRLAAADAAGQAATAHRRAGRAATAMSATARAHRIARACGNATSPAILACDFAPPFSHREREIALLVAQGLTNRQIAQAVSRSVRTVESHVYRASTKAGVTGRAELATMMRNTPH